MTRFSTDEKKYKQLCVDKLLTHFDQGWHYQMKQYRHAFEEHGIKQKQAH